MSTQEGVRALGYSGVVDRQRLTTTRKNWGPLVLLAVLLVTALGVAAYGIFSSFQGGLSKEEQTLVRTAEAQTAHLNAKAAAIAGGLNLSTDHQVPAASAEALEAYAARWEALGQQFTETVISEQALEAYANRWAALTPQDGGSPQALEAYGNRWTALGESYTGVPAVSPKAIEAYGKRWAALAEQGR